LGALYQDNFSTSMAFTALGYIFSLFSAFNSINTIIYAGPDMRDSIQRLTAYFLSGDVEPYVDKQLQTSSILVTF
jgi:hypothetical protein